MYIQGMVCDICMVCIGVQCACIMRHAYFNFCTVYCILIMHLNMYIIIECMVFTHQANVLDNAFREHLQVEISFLPTPLLVYTAMFFLA